MQALVCKRWYASAGMQVLICSAGMQALVCRRWYAGAPQPLPLATGASPPVFPNASAASPHAFRISAATQALPSRRLPPPPQRRAPRLGCRTPAAPLPPLALPRVPIHAVPTRGHQPPPHPPLCLLAVPRQPTRHQHRTRTPHQPRPGVRHPGSPGGQPGPRQFGHREAAGGAAGARALHVHVPFTGSTGKRRKRRVGLGHTGGKAGVARGAHAVVRGGGLLGISGHLWASLST